MLKIWFIDDKYAELLNTLSYRELYKKYPFELFFSPDVENTENINTFDISNTPKTDISMSNFDFLVLDYQLSDSDMEKTGLNTLRKLRSKGFDKPVLLYTSHKIDADDESLAPQDRSVVKKLRAELGQLLGQKEITAYMVKRTDGAGGQPGDTAQALLEKIVELLVIEMDLEKKFFPEVGPDSGRQCLEHDWIGLLDDDTALTFVLPGCWDENLELLISKTNELGVVDTSSKQMRDKLSLRLQLQDSEKGIIYSATQPLDLSEDLYPLLGSCLSEKRAASVEWVVRALKNQEKKGNMFRHYETAAATKTDNAVIIDVHFAVEIPSFIVGRLTYLSPIKNCLNAYFSLLRPNIRGRVELDSFIAGQLASKLEYYGFGILLRHPGSLEINQLIFDLCQDLKSIIKPVFQELYLSDILGPRMVGPSSSHTAGAFRLGRLFRRTLEGFFQAHPDLATAGVKMAGHLHKSFRDTGPGHGTPSAFCTGLFWGTGAEDDPRIADCPIEAKQAIEVSGVKMAWEGFVASEQGTGKDIPMLPEQKEPFHENSVALYVWKAKDKKPSSFVNNGALNADIFIIGESWGGGNVQVRYIGGRLTQGNLIDCKGKDPEFEVVELGADNDAYLFLRKEKRVCAGKTDEKLPWTIKSIYVYPNRYYDTADKQEIDLGPTTENPYRPPFCDLDDLLAFSKLSRQSLPHIAREYEAYKLSRNLTDNLQTHVIDEEMKNSLRLWKDIVEKPLNRDNIADKLKNSETDNFLSAYQNVKIARLNGANGILGTIECRATEIAIKTMIRNSLHQGIVAAPTGGACGIIPAALFALDEVHHFSEDEKVDALLVSALVGLIMHSHVPTSGAAMGCQAETGIGAAMAAAMVVQLMAGDAEAVVHAAALALKNSLGLVCDPVAGRVSTPCIKRNAFKAVEALLAAWMALEGVRSFVSPSQVVKAAATIGRDINEKYRETSRGGLARTSIGMEMSRISCSSCYNRCN